MPSAGPAVRQLRVCSRVTRRLQVSHHLFSGGSHAVRGAYRNAGGSDRWLRPESVGADESAGRVQGSGGAKGQPAD